MIKHLEIHWKERLRIVDFEIIREQMAREQGVSVRDISEMDVRRRMEEIHKLDRKDLAKNLS